MKKLTKEEWVKKCKTVHGDAYDYSESEYVNAKTKTKVRCKKHNIIFEITPGNHINGRGCPICRYEKSSSKLRTPVDVFINKANEIHNGKYDYSKVEYKNNSTKVCIICPEHGEFWQTPQKHLTRKQGCPYCSGNAKRTLESFIIDAQKTHNGKYDYSKSEYFGIHKPLIIICPEHGEFLQAPNEHLRGQGCPKCKGKRIWDTRGRLTVDKVKESFIRVYGDEYDYSLFNEYVNNRTKIPVICKEHGIFYVTPNNHLNGRGCPHCKQSKLEKEVYDFLTVNKIDFIPQYKYDDENKKNSLDFFIPSINTGIECQGEQHFKPVDFANKGDDWAKEMFEKNLLRDEHKNQLCRDKGIKLLYYIPNNITALEYKSLPKFCGLYTNENVCNNLTQIKEGLSFDDI